MAGLNNPRSDYCKPYQIKYGGGASSSSKPESTVWWETAGSWPENPRDFFVSEGSNKCLEQLNVDDAWIKLAIELKIDNHVEVDQFRRDPHSPPGAMMRKWQVRESATWPVLLKALRSVLYPVFQKTVRAVLAGRIGLEMRTGCSIVLVKAWLDQREAAHSLMNSNQYVGTIHAPAAHSITGATTRAELTIAVPPQVPCGQTITVTEAIQLASEMSSTWRGVRWYIRDAFESAHDLRFRLFVPHVIMSAAQLFTTVMQNEVERGVVHEAMRRSGHLRLANAVLGCHVVHEAARAPASSGRSASLYAQDNESSGGWDDWRSYSEDRSPTRLFGERAPHEGIPRLNAVDPDHTDSTPDVQAAAPTLKSKLEDITDKDRDSETHPDVKECSVCMDRVVAVSFHECGHATSCVACAIQLCVGDGTSLNCPECRAKVLTAGFFFAS